MPKNRKLFAYDLLIYCSLLTQHKKKINDLPWCCNDFIPVSVCRDYPVGCPTGSYRSQIHGLAPSL